MSFLNLQNSLQNSTLDTRTIWLTGWQANKDAINVWYKNVYNLAIQDRTVQEIMKTPRTLITLVNWVGTMPADYKQPVKLYFKWAGTYTEIDRSNFPYRFILEWWVNKIIFELNPQYAVYIEYIRKIVPLGLDGDIIALPADFDRDIINYALLEYHRLQRDWLEVSNSLQFAEWQIKETIDNFWLE